MQVPGRGPIAALTLCFCAWVGDAAAQSMPQPAPAPVASLTARTRADIVASVIAQLASTYVDADTGRLIGAVIRRQAGAHAYDTFTDPAAFAQAVTRDLRSIDGDLHLSLRYAPEPPSGGGGRMAGLVPDARQNYGLVKADVLDGNIGYLEIKGFADGAFADAVGDAMRFLSRTDAMIIDVRRNGGGSSEMSHLVFSHFLPPNQPTIRVRSRSQGTTLRHTVSDVPGPRRLDVPLYVLTSRGTGSAAEEFSFVLKNSHRATLVGTRTAGAGHMVAFVPVGEGFILGLSITRVSDPASGREWEQVGVQPDIDVPPEQALLAAQADALRKLLAAHPDSDRARQLTRVLENVEAQRNPPATNP